jgi:hypothetical protein
MYDSNRLGWYTDNSSKQILVGRDKVGERVGFQNGIKRFNQGTHGGLKGRVN